MNALHEVAYSLATNYFNIKVQICTLFWTFSLTCLIMYLIAICLLVSVTLSFEL